MFPRRYWPGRYFTARYWPANETPVPPTPIETICSGGQLPIAQGSLNGNGCVQC
jgi:hypothetical protein